MKIISSIRHRAGQLYWKMLGRLRTWRYRIFKYIRCVNIWVTGCFFRDSFPPEASAKAQYVIICAHPDDETIFFSSILEKQKPFVICMSHRGNSVRRKEFYDALAHWNTNGIMLNLPDIPGFKGIWKICAGHTLKRLRHRFPNVHTVYTHSNSGESGHPHHYAVSLGVSKVFQNCRILTTAQTIPRHEAGALTEVQIRQKYSVIKNCYPSQIKMLETWCPWWQEYLVREHFEE